jgi:plastocyanin
MKRTWRIGAVLAALALALTLTFAFVACDDGTDNGDTAAEVEAALAALLPPPTNHLIEVTAFEVKGSTSIDDLAAPEIDPSTFSAGFGYKGPGEYDAENPDKWQVASYMWNPGQMTARQGDTLDLHVFVLNGNTHETRIEDPDGNIVGDVVVMNRGREYNLSASLEKAGVYRLICSTHAPTMTAEIVVLPRPGG